MHKCMAVAGEMWKRAERGGSCLVQVFHYVWFRVYDGMGLGFKSGPCLVQDFQKLSDRTPYIADLKPSGRYVMEDLHKASPKTLHESPKP